VNQQPREPIDPEDPSIVDLQPEDYTSGFSSAKDGVKARFAKPEAAIIRELVGQVVELVVADIPESGGDELAALVGFSDSIGEPDDPVLARLLPDGYKDDPDAAQEFRRYTESGLRSAKVESAQMLLRTLPASGGRVRLSPEQAEAWLRALNDVRLALGVRLGVTDDFDRLSGEIGAEDPRYAYIQVYQWLAFLQDSLVDALS
jgi:Domain of unknown function (DUF2017)